jgi:hypothetical protein
MLEETMFETPGMSITCSSLPWAQLSSFGPRLHSETPAEIRVLNFPTGSFTKHVLITRSAAQLKSPPLHFQRGQSQSFNATFAQEEEEWAEEQLRKNDPSHVHTFQEYRRQGLVAGAAAAS